MTQAAKDAANFLKRTLRLPSSSFKPRPHPLDLEKYLARCTDDLYAWQRENRPAHNTFRLHDGPPYANGELHVGHALNKILKDIICRSKLAEGRRVDYIPGWDCHGLPIELKALEKHGWKRGQDVEPRAIRDAARAFAQETVDKQMHGFRSWAIMGDWQNHWKTMDKDFEIRQLKVFQAMVENGLIYRKNKPVFWSPSSSTALAEAELEYTDDHVSQAAYVKFPLNQSFGQGSPVHALIWTTTPWTLPANQAIAVHRSLPYALVRSPKHGLLVVAAPRLNHIKNVLDDHLEILQKDLDVNTLLNTTYDGSAQFGHQALNRPIIHADFVSADSGTGLVHCAPGHGMEDYLALQPLIQSGRVAVRAPVDAAGLFTNDASPENPGLLMGKDIFSAGNKTILSILQDQGRLVHQHPFTHKYPIDWRTKEPVIIRATAQWFADLSSIRERALQAIDKVTFMPETGKSRLRSFVGSRTEWCISRQRAWGVPIPAIYHAETGEAVLDHDSISHIISVIEQRGIDSWWSDAPHDSAWIPPKLRQCEYTRGKDTMDVWFDSGSSWTSMEDHETEISKPLADVYIEGTDQHRGWFQSSLLTHSAYQQPSASALQIHPPFSSLITHGFTLDASGKKMSKSLGNVISPSQIIKGLTPDTESASATRSKASKKFREKQPLGPDALRLWVASSDWTTDVVISDSVVKTVHTALDKYRITFKMLLGMLKDYQPKRDIAYEELRMLDQIALYQLAKVAKTVQEAFQKYEFHKAVTALNRYVVADLSGFYFEAIKDIAYCESLGSPRRISLCWTLQRILEHLQEMLAPICPLLVQETWECSEDGIKVAKEEPGKRVLEEIPAEWLDGNDAKVERMLPMILAVNGSVKQAQEAARGTKLLGQSLASDVYIYVKPGLGISDVPLETWREILVVSQIGVEEDEGFRERDYSAQLGDREWWKMTDVVDGNGACVGTAIVASPKMGKCARCWTFAVELEKEEQELELCPRCKDVVKEFE